MREDEFELAAALRAKIKQRERLLFAIMVHGPSAAFDHLTAIRNIYRHDTDSFLEIKWALIEGGMESSEVMEMALGQHEVGCACWRCILLLHSQALRSYHRRKGETERST